MKILTKKKAQEFAKKLCGTAKGVELTQGDIWQIVVGHMKYCFWPLDSRIYCQISVGGCGVSSYYFDFNTYDPDDTYTDDVRQKGRREEWRQDRLEFLRWLQNEKRVSIPESVFYAYSN